MPVSSKSHAIKPFLVMDVLEAAKGLEARGRDIVHLEIGEPDFDTPQCIKDAACRALEAGETGYTHSQGLPELREAICEEYRRGYGVSVDPEQIVVTSGTSPALLLCFAAILEAGDSVAIPDPGYACYANFVAFADGTPKAVPVTEEDGFHISLEALRQSCSEPPRAVMINSPGNPTGTLMTPQQMEDLAQAGHCLVSDEIYHGLTYEGEERSALEFTDNAFVLNGFSKRFAMTGWRLGYLIAPHHYVRPIQKMAQNLFICAGSIVQRAGLAALREAEPDVEHMRRTYDQRRRYMLDRLRKMGLGVGTDPTGAFYILADARHIDSDSYQLAFDILEKAGVAVTPGIDFGQNGEGYIRFSYATSLDRIAEGMDRLQAYVAARTP
jgi:aspartate/methionine/tyrosine aminotransferase